MPGYKRHCILFGIVLATLLSSCSGSSDDLDDVVENENATPSGEFDNGLFMTIQTLDKNQGKYDKGQIFKHPDEAEVKKQFQSLNWTDPNLRPSIKFTRNKDGKLVSMFVLRRNQDNAEGEIQAEWLSSDKKSYMAPKIDSLETALNLLVMYHGDKPELPTAVEWVSLD